MSCSYFFVFIVIFIKIIFPNYVLGELNYVFCPYLQDGDTNETNTYTREDVKEMLDVIVDTGPHKLSTYAVDVPESINEYVANETWKQCPSVVHVALAAAEINAAKKSHSLRVYQGISYRRYAKNNATTSIEVDIGLEVAAMANKIFPNTVIGLIFPGEIFITPTMWEDERLYTLMNKVADYAHENGMDFGLRIGSYCNMLFGTNTSEYAAVLIRKINFIMCRFYPDHDMFRRGPEHFFNDVSYKFIFTISAVNNSAAGKKIDMFLETGWPGMDSAGPPNTDIQSERAYWKMVRESSFTTFMDAFDELWEKENVFELSAYYGKWRLVSANNNVSPGNGKKYKFELKVPDENTSGGAGDDGLSTMSLSLIISGAGLLVSVIIMMITVSFMWSRRNRSGKSTMTKTEIKQFLYGVISKNVLDVEKDGKLVHLNAWENQPYDRNLEVRKEDIEIDTKCQLGYGTFGCVYKGKIKGRPDFVAIKMLHNDSPLSALRGILSEIKVLSYLGEHENIVGIRGAYTAQLTSGVVYLATEFCERGSLEKYLRANKTSYVRVTQTSKYAQFVPSADANQISEVNMLRWAVEIAKAMEYITSKNVIHGDLATRNVLLDSNLTAKVADFGLSRRLYEYAQYVKKNQEPLPWRWMALESLRNLEFSAKSDAWSFGVTLWEIFSFADIPYPGFFWNADFVSQLDRGMRLDKPVRATDSIYELMRRCWELDPKDRPTFTAIRENLVNEQSSSKQRRISI